MENKDKMYDQTLTVITMVQTVFEFIEIMSKIIQLQSSLHFERIFKVFVHAYGLIFDSYHDQLKQGVQIVEGFRSTLVE